MEKFKVFLPDVRISYPSLVEPRAGLQGGDPKNDATFLMAPESGAAHNLPAAEQALAPRDKIALGALPQRPDPCLDSRQAREAGRHLGGRKRRRIASACGSP